MAPSGSAPVLTPEHLLQLKEARKLSAGLRRATAVAKIDGWTTLTFGILTLLLSMGSISGTVLSIGLSLLGFYQIRCADALARLDDQAPWALARNQLLLGAILVAYGAWNLWQIHVNPAVLNSAIGNLDPDLADLLGPYDDLARSLYITLYAGVIAAGIIGPGLMASYYYAQRKRITACRLSTPQWIQDLQRAGVKV